MRNVSLALTAVLLLTGCSPFGRKIDPEKQRQLLEKPAKSGTKVRIGGAGPSLGEAQEPGLSPEKFVQQVDELLRVQRFASTQRFVLRYPDVALEVLRTASATTPARAIQAIAQIHDHQTARGNPESGWYPLWRDRGAQPERFREFEAARQSVWEALRSGRVNDALAVDLEAFAKVLPFDALKIDAAQLAGATFLLAEKPPQAAAAYRRALELSRSQPYQAAHISLLLSEALRRAGDVQESSAAWSSAVELASQSIDGDSPLRDPIFWERAAYLQPIQTNWPAGVLTRFQSHLQTHCGVSPPTNDELLIWSAIGFWRLDRGEAQAALLALKRAEAAANDELITARLQLASARSLMRLNQDAAATAILVRLTGSPLPIVSRPATALLGTLNLRRGGAAQGFQLLKKVVEQNDEPWPGRDDAEADLALAYLMIGDEANGARWLERVQRQYESQGQVEQLLASLDNQAKYLTQTKKDARAKEIRQRIEMIERR